MQKQERHIAVASFLALMLYFGPSMVQDIHRVFSHAPGHHYSPFATATQIYKYSNQCPVCVFEFTSVDDIKQNRENPFIQDWFCVIATEIIFQILGTTHFSFQSRAPPV